MADLLPKPVFQSFKLETAISVTKSMLLSVGIISTVTLFKVAIIPKIATLLITTLPRFWVSLSCWLSPPYVFIIFNFIIIAIAASSTFRHQKETPNTNSSSTSHEDTPDTASNGYKSMHEEQNSSSITIRSREIWHGILLEDGKNDHGEEEGEGKPVKWDFSTLTTEKVADPSPAKFCAYSGEKVEDDGAGESMDATWKAIMERQGKQTPQLKKSETWDSPPRLIRDGDDADDDPAAWARNEIRKSDIFKETLSFRRKKSMSHEELKRRAEAFIEMVNRNIRLQRQESEQRFLQTVKRSV